MLKRPDAHTVPTFSKDPKERRHHRQDNGKTMAVNRERQCTYFFGFKSQNGGWLRLAFSYSRFAKKSVDARVPELARTTDILSGSFLDPFAIFYLNLFPGN